MCIKGGGVIKTDHQRSGADMPAVYLPANKRACGENKWLRWQGIKIRRLRMCVWRRRQRLKEHAAFLAGWIKGRSRRREEGKVRKEADARQQKERERINGLSWLNQVWEQLLWRISKMDGGHVSKSTVGNNNNREIRDKGKMGRTLAVLPRTKQYFPFLLYWFWLSAFSKLQIENTVF